MSKKSRKRNKKILAAIGIGLGAAALASRNKRNKGIDKGIKSAEADKGSDMLPKKVEYITKKKKETPTVKTKRTIQDNKPDPKLGKFGTYTKKDETGQNITKKLKPFENSGLTLGVSKRKKDMDTFKGYATKTGNSRGDLGLTGKPDKKDYFGATVFPKSQAADNFKADNREYGRANTYKSGGRVKGCGKALRGFGKAMKGNR